VPEPTDFHRNQGDSEGLVRQEIPWPETAQDDVSDYVALGRKPVGSGHFGRAV